MNRKHTKTLLTLTEDDKEYIREHYPYEKSEVVANHIGCSSTTISKFARKDGIAKNPLATSERFSRMATLNRR